ncbi:Abi family protein [Staphylococcus aureus]|uniref:Abi family protein n=1 Tax=Staphylococcus aureus TaxID=1280 RepID=UPI0022B8C576|nr:Abi family protein [Staphylococcus aureus]WRM86715.1 Abi family protein [Staphylococcus aureus]
MFLESYRKKKSNDNVKHNIKKYNIIPAWVLFQNFSFGDLSTFIELHYQLIEIK